MPNLEKMTAGARMLYEQAVKKFPAMMGRAPTAEDLAKIEFHAKEFSKPLTEMNPARLESLRLNGLRRVVDFRTDHRILYENQWVVEFCQPRLCAPQPQNQP